MKNDKGITLVALVITIIVMLILVGVTVNIAIGDGGLIKTTREATADYQIEIEKEKAIELAMNYQNAYGKGISEETLEELAKLVIETGIDSSKLTVWYNIGSKSENEIEKEIILYRTDKTTEEEQTILENKGIKSLRGDVTLDGFLTMDDEEYIRLFYAYLIDPEKEDLDEAQHIAGDLSGDGICNKNDIFYIVNIYELGLSYEGGYIR